MISMRVRLQPGRNFDSVTTICGEAVRGAGTSSTVGMMVLPRLVADMETTSSIAIGAVERRGDNGVRCRQGARPASGTVDRF
ncbi:MAG: hypothetical protein RMM29_02680 [Planctomycetota bacterium]|nr:hypothetical protein [Planctomycetota bacterium]MCX8040166.1 hypothetical protein [Planctomycetota bacterium]MDW8372539.1 hypothetical protein [Planctomycetota bacterium]